MTIAAPFRPGFFPAPKLLTRHTSARRQALDEDAAIKAVYREVDDRDGKTCRCCGRSTTTKPSLDRWHTHHHLQPRSTAAKAEKHTRRNVLAACARCHALITAQKIRVLGRNADGAIWFTWTRLATKAEREGLTLRDEASS